MPGNVEHKKSLAITRWPVHDDQLAALEYALEQIVDVMIHYRGIEPYAREGGLRFFASCCSVQLRKRLLGTAR